MADVKWIKLDVDMFSNPKIRKIRRLPEGNNILLIWIMLLTMAGKCNASGMIFITQNIPYTLEDLAEELGFTTDVVRSAILVLENFGMLTTNENTLCIDGWTEHQNEAALSIIRERDRERQAEYRARKKEEKLLEKNEKNTPEKVSQTCHGHVTLLSYSYSLSNSNIDNINILLNTDYIYKDYINNNNRLLNSIKEWFEYKDEKKPKKDNHYTEKGLRKQLTEFVNKDKEFGTDYVVSVIDKSIASQWKGVIWDAVKPNKPTNNYHLQGTKPIEGATNYQAKLEAEMKAKFGNIKFEE